MAPQGREVGKDTSIQDELRPECGERQLWTRKGQQAQGCGQLRVGVTQILTLDGQDPSWPWGAFVRVAVLRQNGRSLLRGKHLQHSHGTLSTSRPLARLPSMSWMRKVAGRVQTDESPHILCQTCNSGQSRWTLFSSVLLFAWGSLWGPQQLRSLLSTALMLPTSLVLPREA